MDYSNLPIEKLNKFIIAAGEIESEKEFVRFVVDGLSKLVHFDQCTVYFFDISRKIVDWSLLNVPPHWNEAFLEYYASFIFTANSELGFYFGKQKLIYYIDWSQVENSPFLEYIREVKILHSYYLHLQDYQNTIRLTIAMDRRNDRQMSVHELNLLTYLAPHLNISYRRFIQKPGENSAQEGSRKLALIKLAGLTRQETKITLQLCDGSSLANISKALNISIATTHKHISHIYKKMNVSNLQELLVYLLGTGNAHIRRTGISEKI